MSEPHEARPMACAFCGVVPAPMFVQVCIECSKGDRAATVRAECAKVLDDFREDEEIRLRLAESENEYDDGVAYSRGVEILDLLSIQIRALAPKECSDG